VHANQRTKEFVHKACGTDELDMSFTAVPGLTTVLGTISNNTIFGFSKDHADKYLLFSFECII
jgi:hypothetical protein